MNKSGRSIPKVLYIPIIAAMIVIELLVLFLVDRPYSKVIINAGQPMIEAKTFFKSGGNVSFRKNDVDTKQPGEYKVRVKKGLFTYTSKVVIVDEVAPGVDYYREMSISQGEKIAPEDLIKSITEDSYYTVAWAHSVDTNDTGFTTAEVVVRDAAGNETRFYTKLHIVDANIMPRLQVEAGTIPDEKVFFKDGNVAGDTYSLTPALNTIDFTVLGEKAVTLKYRNDICQISIMVVDTVAPVATVVEKNVKEGGSLTADAFVSDIVDASPVEVAFARTPDFSALGTVEVRLVLKDAAGNTTYYDTKAHVIIDTTGPAIVGPLERDIFIGEDDSLLSGVRGIDDCDGEVLVHVDREKVDTTRVGDYEVTYWAEDETGNRTQVKGLVHVYASRSEAERFEKAVNTVATAILKDNMSQKDKAKAVYSWVWSHSGYKGTAESGAYDNWRLEALLGFEDVLKNIEKNEKYRTPGDCFTAFAMSKALLEIAGIPTYDLTRIMPNGQNSRHFWLLVNVGEGWYQFDAMSRKTSFGSGDQGGFLFTKAQGEEYNQKRKDYFYFDESLYPDIEIK